MREDVNSLLCARLVFFNLRECSDLLLDATLFSGRPMSGSTFTIYEAGKIRETLSRTCCQNRQETGCPSRTSVESVFQNMCVKRGCLKTPSPLTCETFNPRYYTSLLVIVADWHASTMSIDSVITSKSSEARKFCICKPLSHLSNPSNIYLSSPMKSGSAFLLTFASPTEPSAKNNNLRDFL